MALVLIIALLANTWLLCCIDKQSKKEYRDKELWQVFQEDFEGWRKETFSCANTDIVQEFRNHLQDWGVFITKNGAPIADKLEGVLMEEQPMEWTEIEFQKQIKSKRYFSIGLQERLSNTGTLRLPTDPISVFPIPNSQDILGTPNITPNLTPSPNINLY